MPETISRPPFLNKTKGALLPTVQGYAAKAAGQRLEPFAYEPPPLGESEVRVSVTHCGVCYSDIQAIDDFYGITTYPFVPGHEIVGHVSELGSEGDGLKKGDRVAIGWQARSCGKCEWCLRGEEQLCLDVVSNSVWFPHGGFSSSVTADSRFVYPVPDSMASEHAAVLMCAGFTVFSALRSHSAGPSTRVGVIGVGGLGHLAIQFAHALGCRVTAFSSSPEKREEALGFGADEFVPAGNQEDLKQRETSYDLLLYAAHSAVDWTYLLNALKRRGCLVVMGFPPTMEFDPEELVVRELSVTGSFVGNRSRMREMLSFAKEKGIKPRVELVSMTDANKAIQLVRENNARYRVVLTNDSPPTR